MIELDSAVISIRTEEDPSLLTPFMLVVIFACSLFSLMTLIHIESTLDKILAALT